MLELRQANFAKVDWELFKRFEDRYVFQTREWVEFVAETQAATPVIAEVRNGSATVGYFTGLTFRRFGVRVLGSSFPGWTTPYMGFNLVAGASRSDALDALECFAFRELKCLHLEVCDRHFIAADGEKLGFTLDTYESYETDLSGSEEEIFNRMSSACRRCIRKAERSGVRIEEAQDEAFARQYYAQLQDVFAKQNLTPTYDLGRVKALIRHLQPSGNLLLLRARDGRGNCIGTGIYPGLNQLAEMWGNASFRHSQILRPNESLHWYAMRYWRRRGARVFDWGGGGEYKEKYGSKPVAIPRFRKSRFGLLDTLRQGAHRAVRLKQGILGRLHGRSVPPKDTEAAE